MASTPLSAIVRYFDSILPPDSHVDSSLNGLQVESPEGEVHKISFAVDSGESVIKRAVENGSQLLVVHHGLLWGAPDRLIGPMSRKLALLFRHGCSLYASHLPLDGDLAVGNGAELARFLGFEQIEPAFSYKGGTIGVRATLPEPLQLDEIIDNGSRLVGSIAPYVIRAGNPQIRSAAIVTGAGAFALTEAARMGVDLLISGEPKQEAFHMTHELGINALFLGHYATETLGVLALKREIERQFTLKTEFIDIPTGI